MYKPRNATRGESPERFKAPEAYELSGAPGLPRPVGPGSPWRQGLSYYGERGPGEAVER